MARRRRRGKGTAPRPEWFIWLVAGVIAIAACVLMGVVVIPALTADDDEAAVDPADAPFLYERNCGTCHGLQGQGNIGPQLADGAVVTAYPDIDDQIAVIADGRAEMPPFGDDLTDNEIEAIAVYTRTLLGTEDQPPATTTPG